MTHFQAHKLDARTLLVVFEATKSSTIEDELSIDDFQRFVTDQSRVIHSITDDLIVDVSQGIVDAGLAEMTDDVDARSTFPRNCVITRDSALVMHVERKITWNFDLPQESTDKAVQDAADWLRRNEV